MENELWVEVADKTYRLERGKHLPWEGSACLLEIVSQDLGQHFSDYPDGVAVTLRCAAIRAWDTAHEDEYQALLKRYRHRLPGTADRPNLAELFESSAALINSRMISVWIPLVLELAGRSDLVGRMRNGTLALDEIPRLVGDDPHSQWAPHIDTAVALKAERGTFLCTPFSTEWFSDNPIQKVVERAMVAHYANVRRSTDAKTAWGAVSKEIEGMRTDHLVLLDQVFDLWEA